MVQSMVEVCMLWLCLLFMIPIQDALSMHVQCSPIIIMNLMVLFLFISLLYYLTHSNSIHYSLMKSEFFQRSAKSCLVVFPAGQ